MLDGLKDAMFRLNARRRREISALGWLIIFVTVFFVAAGTAFSFGWYGNRELKALATASPAAIAPAGMTSVPAATTLTEDQKRQVADARQSALEIWTYLAFPLGVPDDEIVKAQLVSSTVDGVGRGKLLSLAARWRSSGQYWRRPLVNDHAWVDQLTSFSPGGQELTVALFYPENRILAELVNIGTSEVVRREMLPAFVIVSVMRYQPEQGRWLLADYSVTGASASLPDGVFWP